MLSLEKTGLRVHRISTIFAIFYKSVFQNLKFFLNHNDIKRYKQKYHSCPCPSSHFPDFLWLTVFLYANKSTEICISSPVSWLFSQGSIPHSLLRVLPFSFTLPRDVFRSAPTVSIFLVWPPTPLCGSSSLFNWDPTDGHLGCPLGGFLQV